MTEQPIHASDRAPSPTEHQRFRFVSIGVDEIERVRDLWDQMRHGYADLVTDACVREPTDSWRRRRLNYERELFPSGGFVIGLEEAGRLVGYAAVRLVEPSSVFDRRGEVAELVTIVVASELRGLGLGAALMEEVRRESLGRGCVEVELQVLVANERAIEFYRELGFTHWIVTLRQELGGTPDD